MIVALTIPVTSSAEAAALAEVLERLADQARLGRDHPGYAVTVSH